MSSGRVVEQLSLTPSVFAVPGSSPGRPPFGEVALWRAPFHWGNPNGSPGSTPGLSMCGSSSVVEHQYFRILEVVRFDTRLPHCRHSSNGRAVLVRWVRLCRFKSCCLRRFNLIIS